MLISAIIVITFFIVALVSFKIYNKHKEKKKEKQEYNNIDFLNLMYKEIEKIKKTININAKYDINTNNSIFYVYKNKITCEIKYKNSNYIYIYRNILRHRIKIFKNFDEFRCYYFNNRSKMIQSIEKVM